MPTLYSARDGSEAQPNVRVTLTFGELRWMFGVEVADRDGKSEQFPEPGFYLLVGLSTGKADELLKYRERYAQRLDGAEIWEIGQRHRPGRRTPP